MSSPIIKGIECPAETHAPGSVIFQEGSPGDCFYIVKGGEVDIFRNYGKANQVHLATIPTGKVLGEIAGLDGQPRTATAIAKTEAHVMKISVQSLQWQLNQCPAWFRTVILELADRLRKADDRIANP